MMTDDLQEALKDLTKRNLKVVAFVTSDADSKLSILEYDTNGNATFISSTVDNIHFTSRLKGNMVRSLGEIKPVETEAKAKEEPDALTCGTSAKKKENIKLHKKAIALLAIYRKELNKNFASMRSDFKSAPLKYAKKKVKHDNKK